MIRWTWYGHTVSLELLAWMVLSLTSFGFSAYCLRAARNDLRYQILSGVNGIREIIARGNLRREWLRLTAAAAYVYVGVHAYLHAPAAHLLPKIPLHDELAILALLYGSFMLAFSSVSEFRDRRRVLDHLERSR